MPPNWARVCGAGAFAAALAASGCHGAPSSPAEPPGASGVYSLPADRLTSWNPGIPGGIPARNTVCATVDASAYGNGALDATAAIQAAIGACPEGQVVSLSAGTFAITGTLLIDKGIVLRGKGPQKTLLQSNITFFRNHATGKRRSFPDVDNRRAIGLMAGSWWYTFVGNVLGYPGMSAVPYSSFRYESALPWDPQPVPMWQLGYDPEDWKRAADPRVLSTVIREGNFDYATGQVHWSNGPYQLPDSLYLSGKPAFFGDGPWPWVDPTGTTKLHTLPARTRFAAMNP